MQASISRIWRRLRRLRNFASVQNVQNGLPAAGFQIMGSNDTFYASFHRALVLQGIV